MEEDTANQDKLEVIEVSAQKHPQPLEDIAIAVSVIDGRTVEEQNFKDTTALSSIAPNFKITQNAAEGTPPAVNIRGVGSLDYNTSTTSPVGVYLDNVSGGSANSQLINLFDVESVEVLRGPQGTLFGRNTTGGAILINSVKPKDQFESYLTVSFAQQDHQSAEGAINLPIDSHSATRFAFSHHQYQYSTNNLYGPAPVSDMKQTMGRLSYAGQWQHWEVFAKVHGERWDGIVQPAGSIGIVKSFDPATGQPATLCTPAEAGSTACTDSFGFNSGSNNFYDVAVNNDINNNSPHNSESWGGDVHLNYQMDDDTRIETIFSINSLNRVHYFNSDASPARIGEGGQNVYTDVSTAEIRLHKQYDDMYLIAGVYYLDESLTQDNQFDLFRDFRASPQLFSFAAKFKYDNDIDTQAKAIFGHGEFQLTEKASLTTGLRYTDESTDYHALGHVNIATQANDQDGLTLPAWDVTGSVDDGSLSGKLALNYKFARGISSYLSYSRGYKSGGYNGALVSSAEAAERNDYGPEKLDAYEIGARLTSPQGKSSVNLALFYYDYRNQQVFMNQQAIDPGAPPLQLLDNVGKSKIYGLEGEWLWRPLPQLKFHLSAGYLPTAKLESFVDAAGIEIKNNRLPFTSRTNLSGLGEYVVGLNNAELVFQLAFDYQSRFYFDQNQNEYASQDGYTLVNARVAWQQANWTLALWGKNLTNREYSNLKFDLSNFWGMLEDFKGEKRQLGVDIGYVF